MSSTKKTASKRSQKSTTTEPLRPTGRPGALTEQIVFRISKATRGRLEKRRRELQLDNMADTLRVVLRECGL